MNTGQSGKGTVSASSDAADLIAASSNDPGACRYRCAHVAWLDVEHATQTLSQTAVAAMVEQVERGAARLHQLDLVCQRMAFFRPHETVFCAPTPAVLSCWVPQAHLAMLIAMYAMQSLRLHSAWQLLAQPRNHVARSCLNTSRALLDAFTSNNFHCISPSRECLNLNLIGATLEMVRAEHRHWFNLLQEAEQQHAISRQDIHRLGTRHADNDESPSPRKPQACKRHDASLTLVHRQRLHAACARPLSL